jgi:hypothetical protein
MQRTMMRINLRAPVFLQGEREVHRAMMSC